jgi:putative hydrolase of the HAD superfamily
MAADLRAVTFDFWNTIIQEDHAGLRPRRIDAWLGLFEGEGVALERERLDAAFASTWDVFDQHWRGNRARFGAEQAVDHVLGELGHEPPDDVRRALVKVLTDPPVAHDPSPTPNIDRCLATLKAAGLRIGIICDVGLTPSRTLRRYLDAHGLLDSFDHWSFSDEVGVFKPDPVIFGHALAGLGIDDPSQAAHVGDLRRTDVAGANAMGMTSVRYTGVFDDPGAEGDPSIEADHVVVDHADLAGVLGLSGSRGSAVDEEG